MTIRKAEAEARRMRRRLELLRMIQAALDGAQRYCHHATTSLEIEDLRALATNLASAIEYAQLAASITDRMRGGLVEKAAGAPRASWAARRALRASMQPVT